MKVLENYQKNIFISVPFKKFELSNLPAYNYSKNWLHRKCFLFYAPRIFEIAVRASVVQPLFSKVMEKSVFCDSVKKSNTCMVSSEK